MKLNQVSVSVWAVLGPAQSQLVTCFLLFSTCYLLLASHFLLLATCYLLLATWNLVLTTCYSVLGTCYSFASFFLLLTSYFYLPLFLTSFFLLLTSHFYLLPATCYLTGTFNFSGQPQLSWSCRKLVCKITNENLGS